MLGKVCGPCINDVITALWGLHLDYNEHYVALRTPAKG